MLVFRGNAASEDFSVELTQIAQRKGLDRQIPFVFGDELVRARLDGQGEPRFVAKHVRRVLDISNHNDAMATLDEDEKAHLAGDEAFTQFREVNMPKYLFFFNIRLHIRCKMN